MPDELDPRLLRAFAHAESDLAAEPFVSAVSARVQPARGWQLASAAGIYALLETVFRALAGGIVLPLRMRRTRLMTLGAAAVTIWAAFL
jgi:hypothetical protein